MGVFLSLIPLFSLLEKTIEVEIKSPTEYQIVSFVVVYFFVLLVLYIVKLGLINEV